MAATVSAPREVSQAALPFSPQQLRDLLREDWDEISLKISLVSQKLGELRDVNEMRVCQPFYVCIYEFHQFPRNESARPPEFVEALNDPYSGFRNSVDKMCWEMRERLALLKRFIDSTTSATKMQALLPTFRLLKLSLSKLNALPLLADSTRAAENLSFTVRARRMTLKRQQKIEKTPASSAPLVVPALPLPAPVSDKSSASSSSSSPSPSPSPPSSLVRPAAASAPPHVSAEAKVTEPKIRSSGRLTSLLLPNPKPAPLINEAELAEAAPPAYLSAWLNVHLKKGGKYTRRRLWVVLDEDLLRCAPTPAQLESSGEVYDIEAISQANWSKHRSEDVYYIDMHFHNEGKEFSLILLLESKQEMITWALAIDGMRMIRANDGWAVASCWDVVTKNQLLQWRFKEPFKGGLLTFLRKDDSPEEWTYFADGRLECMEASKRSFNWDGENLIVYGDTGAHSIAATAFGAFNGVLATCYLSQTQTTDCWMWHCNEREWRRHDSSPLYNVNKPIRYHFHSGSSLTKVFHDDTETSDLTVEGSIPEPIAVLLTCLRELMK